MTAAIQETFLISEKSQLLKKGKGEVIMSHLIFINLFILFVFNLSFFNAESFDPVVLLHHYHYDCTSCLCIFIAC